ncbi:MAG: VTT domain-containing protein [Chryseolinea sp.]
MDLLNPYTIIQYGGLALLLFVLFAETGLFFGFFLPGDSLVFMAGLLNHSGFLTQPLWLLITLMILAASSGTTLGYWFGLRAKRFFRNKKENFFYKKKYIETTQDFYKRYGMTAFILGRFLPIVRTFVPILAGMVHIDFKKFLFYNILGAVLWITSLVMAGYWMGNFFPGIVDYLEIIIVSMIVVTSLPVIFSWQKYRKSEVRKKQE